MQTCRLQLFRVDALKKMFTSRHFLVSVHRARYGTFKRIFPCLITSYVIVAELLAKLLLLLWRYIHIVLISSNQV